MPSFVPTPPPPPPHLSLPASQPSMVDGATPQKRNRFSVLTCVPVCSFCIETKDKDSAVITRNGSDKVSTSRFLPSACFPFFFAVHLRFGRLFYRSARWYCHDKNSICCMHLRFSHLFCLSVGRFVGLVVKASASRVADPGFDSRLRRDSFRVESYQ